MTEDNIYHELKMLLVEMFEIDPDKISLEARLNEDLDIDSIDAVDLIVKMRQITGKRIEPEMFKTVRTLGDVVTALTEMR